MEHCAECGFTYADAVTDRLAGFGERYAAALDRLRDVRRRPAVGVWSPLEYTCHVRDVFRVQRARVVLALAVDEPVFTPMGREERAVADRYNEQDPQAVLTELTVAGTDLAATFAGLSPAELLRTGVYNWPERQVRTLLWVGRHSVHEGEHHLDDIRRGGDPFR